ncbi:MULTISPECIES: UDP-2,3-diacylglucosamine diphosphatase LpxI [unclassified Ruegeria]|uniref:LpxI family protein n=1 Tax=unclassified Ruegeria TaxID=2625375 RepID=UPI001ADBD481|nr:MULTISPECIES: UDP-2,3-diacylglucosamine diphosphatase LpxI [unclassified Ruegeria]MBO9413322.1 UDP-2,3-diacylglucosamine diphosphatase LpxI [Ruegeria sp. R8_1]MBO9413986.1 UDP-2,3-diacylglucosamine diphosphatase LpxI [Ruegeria sp. R8_2]
MLALIAGTGALPAEVVAQLAERPVICAMEGFPPDVLDADVTFPLEQLGTFIADLKARGVTQICMAGAVQRPAIDPSRIDAATMPLVPILQQAIMSGDDGALRAVIEIFEDAGLEVRAAHEIAPNLLPELGSLTKARPTEADLTDADRAAGIVRAMGAADIGQACVVSKGQALAVEGIFGTAWMLQSLTQRPDAGGGVLFKAPKPDQDRRADLPAIGPDTVSDAVAAGLAGIVIEKGGVMVLQRQQVIAECDRLGLFLYVRERAI